MCKKTMRISALLTAMALLMGIIPASAEEMAAPRIEVASIIPYETTSNGFQPKSSDGAELKQVRIVRFNEDVFYSVLDLAQAADIDTVSWCWGYSRFFYHFGKGGQKAYDVRAYLVTLDGQDFECQFDRLCDTDEDSICVRSNEKDGYALCEADGEAYMTAAGIHSLFSGIYQVQPDEGGEVQYLASCDRCISSLRGVDADARASLTNALWMMYNQYPVGYDLVTTYTKFIILTDAETARRRTGKDYDIRAFVLNRGSTVYIVNDPNLWCDMSDFCAAWVHEAAHLEAFRHGDRSETPAVLAQAKALYALGYTPLGVELRISVPYKEYAEGIAAAMAWLDEVSE